MMNNNDKLIGIYLGMRGRLSRTVARIVPSKEIEDIVQETYVRVCQIRHTDDILYPRSFLLKTAQNLAFDYLKRADTRLVDQVDLEEEGVLPFEAGGDETFDRAASDEEFAHFCEAVRLLPVQCRKVFILKKVYGYTQREIAQEFGISENTVENHIALGVKRCIHFMERDANQAAPEGRGYSTARTLSVTDDE